MSLLVATQLAFRMRSQGDPLTWQWLVLFPLAYWYGWALLTPLIFEVSRRWTPMRRPWRVVVPVHVGSALGASVVMLAWYALLMHWLGGDPDSTVSGLFMTYLVLGFHYDVLTYAAILGVGFARNYRSMFRERADRAMQLENRLIHSQLEVLRMQLRPHFLFNTLHAVSSLVEDDPEGARRMIARLSGLLRQTLDLGDRQEIPLREELEILDGYLDIEACRFQDRLQVTRDVDPECLDALVPSLLLQPLVENAVRHGIDERDGRCRIDVSARAVEGRLELAVRDRGPGLPAHVATDVEEGIGVSNVRARLEQMYPGEGALALEEAKGGGVRAIVSMPLRRAQAGDARGRA
jgi:two-component sensor histidine kinase